MKLNGTQLEAGGAAAISEEKSGERSGVEDAEVLLFDLAQDGSESRGNGKKSDAAYS